MTGLFAIGDTAYINMGRHHEFTGTEVTVINNRRVLLDGTYTVEIDCSGGETKILPARFLTDIDRWAYLEDDVA